jgi:hypothetical protein
MIRLALRISALATLGVFLSACSYKAPTQISPAYNVYTNYSDKIPGRYALHVDGSKFSEDVAVSGFACSAHTFPVDARYAFEACVRETL